MRYFVHYAVLDESGKFRRLVAGPYTMDEALAKRRDLNDGRNYNVFVAEEAEK